MAWIYLAESEGSLKRLKGTPVPSLIVKTTDTLKRCYCREWLAEICQWLQSGTTFVHSVQNCYLLNPKLSTGASHVRTLALLVAEQAWKESEAAYSSRSLGLSAKYDRSTSSWRTSQQSLFGGGNELLESFASSGMTVDGAFYPLRMWARITDAKDGGFWRTPDTGAGGTSGLLKAGKTQRKSGAAITMRLVDQVNNPWMWPTPAANKTTRSGDLVNSDGTLWDGIQKPHSKRTGRQVTTALADKVNMWPTPRSADGLKGTRTLEGHEKERLRRGNGVDLPTAVNYPTPAANPSRGLRSGDPNDKNRIRSEPIGGSLNPQFVEWLMGYPKNWTVIESWAERKK